MKDLKYKRIDISVKEADLLDINKLDKIEKNLYILNGQLQVLYASTDVYKLIKNHLNTLEAITTANIDGSDLKIDKIGLSTLGEKKKQEEKQLIDIEQVLTNFKDRLEKHPSWETILRQLHTDINGNCSLDIDKIVLKGLRDLNLPIKNKRGEIVLYPCEKANLREELGVIEEIWYEYSTTRERIINSGIIHAMFERIHPFSYGNGKIGRLLIPLYLMNDFPFPVDPIIMVSQELFMFQKMYYRKLYSIQETGTYIEFLDFYFDVLNSALKRIIKFNKEFISFYTDLKNKLKEVDNNFLSKGNNTYLMSLIIAKKEIVDLRYIKEELFKLKEEGLLTKIPSDESIRNLLKELEGKDILKSISKKPLRYKIVGMPSLIS